jgi:hypothetical protein
MSSMVAKLEPWLTFAAQLEVGVASRLEGIVIDQQGNLSVDRATVGLCESHLVGEAVEQDS